MSGERLEAFLRLAALDDLIRLRRSAALLLFSVELHRTDRFADAAEGYVDRLGAATGLRHEPATCLDEVDPHLLIVHAVRGRALHSRLVAQLRERFDEDWFRNPRAGTWVSELWSGGEEDAEAIAAEPGGRELEYTIETGLD